MAQDLFLWFCVRTQLHVGAGYEEIVKLKFHLGFRRHRMGLAEIGERLGGLNLKITYDRCHNYLPFVKVSQTQN